MYAEGAQSRYRIYRGGHRAISACKSPADRSGSDEADQMRPSCDTVSRSSASSAVLASMRERLNSSISSPCTICQLPPAVVVTGNDDSSPSGTPYDPSDITAIDTQSPSGEPCSQSRAASIVADAADAADEAPRASMMAAPRLATVGIKSSSIQERSLTTSTAFLPSTSAWKISGYCVAE